MHMNKSQIPGGEQPKESQKYLPAISVMKNEKDIPIAMDIRVYLSILNGIMAAWAPRQAAE